MAAPTIRSGFPVVADHAAAAPPYNVLTDAFSANAGDELVAFAIGAGLPTVVSRNAADTGAGSLVWIRRYVCRANYLTAAPLGVYQVACYTAVVPTGGVTERALYVTDTIANDGNQAVSGSQPARLIVVAADNTNGVGAIAFAGSISGGSGSTAGLAATQTIRPFANESLLLGAGWFVNGATPTAATGSTEVVAPGTNRMPMYSRVTTAPSTPVAVGSAVTDSTLWALGLVEYLPTAQPKPSRKLFVLGTSGVESNNCNYQLPIKIQDDLAPDWEVFNQGVFWAHTGQIRARWDAGKATYPAFDAIVIHAGSNDLADYSAWNATSQANLQGIYDDVAALGVPAVCYAQMALDGGAGAPTYYYDFRDWVHQHAPAGSFVYDYRAICDPAAGYLSVLPAYDSGDSIHLSAAGNVVIGAQISQWIAGLGVGVAQQTAYPNADITDGAWTPSTGTDLFACIDDTTSSEWIATTSNSTCRGGVAALANPESGARTLFFQAGGSPEKRLIATLIEGASTVRGSLTLDPLLPGTYLLNPSGVTDYGDLDWQFEVADATASPTVGIAFGAIGAGATGSTSVAVPVPAAIAAGHYLTLHVTSGATNDETPDTPSGWTLLATGASTDGTFGVDTGPRRATVFGKVADGTETTTTVTIANGDTCYGTMARWRKKNSGYDWSVVAEGANDSTDGTGVSMATAAIDWAAGDCAAVVVAQRVDSATQSAQSLTASGTSFGARTNRATTAVTTGNDHRHVVDTFAAVTTGGGSAATTWAYTASAAVSAGGVVVRLREVPPTDKARIYTVKLTTPAAAGVDLFVADVAHGHGTDAFALTTLVPLSVAHAIHGHSLDAPNLNAQLLLIVADLLHGNSAAQVTLNDSSETILSVADALHEHGVDAAGLSTQALLAVADALHEHLADSASLTSMSLLAVEDASHGHAADAPSLSTQVLLSVADALHGHGVDAAGLSTQSLLAVADALHEHLADGITLAIVIDGFGIVRVVAVVAADLTQTITAEL